jgi:hypothetical protein
MKTFEQINRRTVVAIVGMRSEAYLRTKDERRRETTDAKDHRQ